MKLFLCFLVCFVFAKEFTINYEGAEVNANFDWENDKPAVFILSENIPAGTYNVTLHSSGGTGTDLAMHHYAQFFVKLRDADATYSHSHFIMPALVTASEKPYRSTLTLEKDGFQLVNDVPYYSRLGYTDLTLEPYNDSSSSVVVDDDSSSGEAKYYYTGSVTAVLKPDVKFGPSFPKIHFNDYHEVSPYFYNTPFSFDRKFTLNDFGYEIIKEKPLSSSRRPYVYIVIREINWEDEASSSSSSSAAGAEEPDTRRGEESSSSELDIKFQVLCLFPQLESYEFPLDMGNELKNCLSTSVCANGKMCLEVGKKYDFNVVPIPLDQNPEDDGPLLDPPPEFGDEPDTDLKKLIAPANFRTMARVCGGGFRCAAGKGSCSPETGKCNCHANFDGEDCSHRTNLSPVIIAVIAIGCILVVAIIAGIVGVFCFKRYLKSKRKITLVAPDFEKLRFVPVKTPEYPPEIASRFDHKLIEQIIVNDEAGMNLVWEVCKATPVTESDNLAKSLVFAFERHQKSLSLIMFLITKEVTETNEEPETLFRANSYATKAFKFYSKMIGLPYLFRTIAILLQGMLRDLEDQEESTKMESQSDVKLFKVQYELDPDKLDESGDENINVLMLQLTCQKFLVQILRSSGDCPGEFKQLCAHIQRVINDRFPGYVYKAIGAFIFLRFFNTGITVPETYGLMAQPPKPMARRQLILLSKVLQNLANGVKFGAKESFMTKLNGFITQNQEKLKGFYDRLCDSSAFATEKVSVPDSIYQPSLAHIYYQCANAYLSDGPDMFSNFSEIANMLGECTNADRTRSRSEVAEQAEEDDD